MPHKTSQKPNNKRKIINDPVYGFISLPSDLVFDLVEHPFFQRLRRIKQLGLTHLVYPGALHTRFHHALGALWLTTQAIEVLKSKGVEITEKEVEAVEIAVLLHDLGHGPFSHALESIFISELTHEEISLILMERLNKEFDGKLELAISIFRHTYKKKFLSQLVSGQLDMDRLDYLRRDCFFTGVLEGMIGSDRIIKMLDVRGNELVVEEKGIYSIEKFLISRRLMYWQVYLHKTVLGAETLLSSILRRAKELAEAKVLLFATPAFEWFLYNKITKKNFAKDPKNIDLFTRLDDHDITVSIKEWAYHNDKVLSTLCRALINRDLPRVLITTKKPGKADLKKVEQKAIKKFGLNKSEVDFFVMSGSVENKIYKPDSEQIKILQHNGHITYFNKASDQLNTRALSKTVKKYFVCEVH